MPRTPLRVAAVLVAGTLLACSDAVSPDYLAGTWTATKMEFRDPANPSTSVDLIAEGAEFTMTFTADGSVQSSQTQDGGTETKSGTYTLNDSNIVLKFGSQSLGGIIEKTDAGLSLFIYAGIAFDFGEGDVPAELSLLLTPA